MKLAKLMAVNSFYRITNVFTVFLITVLLSRLTGTIGFGLFSLMIANATFLNLALSFGSEAGIAYHSASTELSPGFLFRLLWLIVLFQLVATCIVEGISYYFTGHFLILNVKDISTAAIGILFILSLSVGEKFMFLLNGAQLFSLCNKVILVYNVISLFVFSFLILGKTNDDLFLYFRWYVFLHVLQTITLVIAWCRIHRQKLIVSGSFTKEKISVFFAYSSIAFISNIVQFAAYRADLWFVNIHYAGSKELGWYSLAVRLSQFYWLIPGLLASILMVTIAQKKERYNKENLHVILRFLNTGGLFVLFLFMLSSWWLITTIFGSSYKEANCLFLILLPGFFLFCNSIILSSYFAGIRQLRTNLRGSVLCLLSVVSCAFILVPACGTVGAAIAASLSFVLTAAYFVFVYCSQNKVSVSELFILRKKDWQYAVLLVKKLINK